MCSSSENQGLVLDNSFFFNAIFWSSVSPINDPKKKKKLITLEQLISIAIIYKINPKETAVMSFTGALRAETSSAMCLKAAKQEDTGSPKFFYNFTYVACFVLMCTVCTVHTKQQTPLLLSQVMTFKM